MWIRGKGPRSLEAIYERFSASDFLVALGAVQHFSTLAPVSSHRPRRGSVLSRRIPPAACAAFSSRVPQKAGPLASRLQLAHGPGRSALRKPFAAFRSRLASDETSTGRAGRRPPRFDIYRSSFRSACIRRADCLAAPHYVPGLSGTTWASAGVGCIGIPS